MKKLLKYISATALLMGVVLAFVPGLASAARTAVQSVGGYFAVASDTANVYWSGGAVGINTSAPTSAGLSVVGVATSSGRDILKVASSTGLVYFSVSSEGTTTVRQIVGTGAPTTTLSTGAGAPIGFGYGTSTLSTGSTDLSGLITVVTSSAPTAQGTVFTMRMGSTTNAFCGVNPASLTSATVASTTFVTMATTSWTLKSTLLSTTTYSWVYQCN